MLIPEAGNRILTMLQVIAFDSLHTCDVCPRHHEEMACSYWSKCSSPHACWNRWNRWIIAILLSLKSALSPLPKHIGSTGLHDWAGESQLAPPVKLYTDSLCKKGTKWPGKSVSDVQGEKMRRRSSREVKRAWLSRELSATYSGGPGTK